MAGGVFVEQSIIKEHAAVVDGRTERHERALAEHRRPFVHLDHLFKRRLALRRMDFDRPAVFKAHGEVADELPLIGERLGGIDDALRLSLFGGSEALFGRDVRIEIHARERPLPAAREQALFQQPDAQARAVRAFVFEGSEPQGIEVSAPLFQRLVVRLPVRHRVAFQRTGGGEDGAPQLFLRGGRSVFGEDLLRPRPARNGGDAPLIFVLHLVAVRLYDALPRLHRAGELFAVRPVHAVRVFALYVQPRRQAAHLAAQLFLLPGPHFGEHLFALAERAEARKRLVRPFHAHAGSARAVTFFGCICDESGLIQPRRDDDFLPLLHVQPDAREQLRIILQYRFLHGSSLNGARGSSFRPRTRRRVRPFP